MYTTLRQELLCKRLETFKIRLDKTLQSKGKELESVTLSMIHSISVVSEVPILWMSKQSGRLNCPGPSESVRENTTTSQGSPDSQVPRLGNNGLYV